MRDYKIFGLALIICLMALIFARHNMLLPAQTQIPTASNAGADKDIVPDEVIQNLSKAKTISSDENIRKFPYPYKAMLAIVSDSDSATPAAFSSIHRFLNTNEETEYGTGLGLDVSDSFWLYMGSNLTDTENTMTYFSGLSGEKLYADKINHYINCGWLDSIHTFGDFSRLDVDDITFSNELALSGWQELETAQLNKLSVWIDHGNAANVQNFGAYNPLNASRYQAGDNPFSKYYHTNMTTKNGIRFIWHSRHDDRFGHDFPLVEKILRDGQKIWGFYRYSCEMDGKTILWNWSPEMLPIQLSETHLNSIVENAQYALVAQHLGYYGDNYTYTPKAIESLKLLAAYQHDKKEILVARTSRLLNYCVSQKYINYKTTDFDGKTYINITGVDDPVSGFRVADIDELRGICFYSSSPENTKLLIGGESVERNLIQINPPDETGKASIMLKWFESDTNDYSLD